MLPATGLGASVLCILAVGMTLVILGRGVDLSAGSILGKAGATLARVGVLTLAVLGNLLNLKGVSPFVQMVLQGS